MNKPAFRALGLLLLFFALPLGGEVIEKIYAIVNGEIITYSEYKERERNVVAQLSMQYQGEDLEEQISTMKESLLDNMIRQKLLLAEAKSRDYEVDEQLNIFISNIKEEYGFSTDEEFRNALKQQGISYSDFIEFQRQNILVGMLTQEEIHSAIQVDSAEIMDFYRSNQERFAVPEQVSLNAIFLNRDQFFTEEAREEKQDEILEALSGENFEEVARKYSDTAGTGDKPAFLGEFTLSELDEKIQAAAQKLKPGEYSPDWIEVENGYYLIQLVQRSPRKLKEYKDVRAEIEQILQRKEQQELLNEYIEKLKADSYIKIYKESAPAGNSE